MAERAFFHRSRRKKKAGSFSASECFTGLTAHARCSVKPEASVKIPLIVGLAAASLLAVFALPVQAQTSTPQTACRSVYLLGERVPPGCPAARRSGPPEYQRWGDGHGTNSATQLPDSRRPADYGLYHFGGHNALYGLG